MSDIAPGIKSIVLAIDSGIKLAIRAARSPVDAPTAQVLQIAESAQQLQQSLSRSSKAIRDAYNECVAKCGKSFVYAMLDERENSLRELKIGLVDQIDKCQDFDEISLSFDRDAFTNLQQQGEKCCVQCIAVFHAVQERLLVAGLQKNTMNEDERDDKGRLLPSPTTSQVSIEPLLEMGSELTKKQRIATGEEALADSGKELDYDIGKEAGMQTKFDPSAKILDHGSGNMLVTDVDEEPVYQSTPAPSVSDLASVGDTTKSTFNSQEIQYQRQYPTLLAEAFDLLDLANKKTREFKEEKRAHDKLRKETGQRVANSNSSSTSMKSIGYPIRHDSSFYRLGGFCEGARLLMKGESGFKVVKRPSVKQGQYSASVSARCVKCAYEVEWNDIERDRMLDRSGVYIMFGIRWRQKFISKCHVKMVTIDEPLYACIFCIKDNKTIEEHDATVFFSVGQLFRHLAKHSHPLPNIARMTILYGYQPFDVLDFDLNFTITNFKAAQWNIPVIAAKFSSRPSAQAMITYHPKSTTRAAYDPDGNATLHFAAGAKIVGIDFPDRFNGQWCVGYHDGERGSFPAVNIALETPPKEDVLMNTQSNLVATAKWDFKPVEAKEGKQGSWLTFSKGDQITCVGYQHQGHWCWSGQTRTSKGKWGIFPASFVENLQESGKLVPEQIISSRIGTPEPQNILQARIRFVATLQQCSWAVLRLFRPRLEIGYQRLEWQCDCGMPLYGDFRGDSEEICKLAREIQAHGYVVTRSGHGIKQMPAGWTRPITSSSAISAPPGLDTPHTAQTGPISPTDTTSRAPGGTEYPRSVSTVTADPLLPLTGQSGRFVTLCVNTGSFQKIYHEIDISTVPKSTQMFHDFKRTYEVCASSRNNPLRRWFTKPVDIKFIQFAVEGLRRVYPIPGPPDCTICAHAEKMDELVAARKYEPHISAVALAHPPIPPDLFFHLWECPAQITPTVQNMWLNRLPKKLNVKLENMCLGTRPDGELVLGWGVFVIEGLHKRRISRLTVAIMALSIFVSVAYSAGMKDVSSGFAIGALLVACWTLFITALYFEWVAT